MARISAVVDDVVAVVAVAAVVVGNRLMTVAATFCAAITTIFVYVQNLWIGFCITSTTTTTTTTTTRMSLDFIVG